MFKIKYSEVRANGTLSALSKLTQCTELNFKVAYNVMRMAKTIDIVLRDSQKEFIKICEKYVVKLPTGNFSFNDDGPVFLEGVDVDEGKKAIDEFNEKETIIERVKLNILDLAPAKLSPGDLYAIEWMLEE